MFRAERHLTGGMSRLKASLAHEVLLSPASVPTSATVNRLASYPSLLLGLLPVIGCFWVQFLLQIHP